MKTKLLLFFLLIITSLYSQTPLELNDRAKVDIIKDPSVALYYTDYALSQNLENREDIEYIRSLYYKFKIYKEVALDAIGNSNLIESYEYNKSKGFPYSNIEYWRDVLLYFINKGSDEVIKIIDNSSIVDGLDQKGLIEFKIMDFQNSIFFGEDISEKFSQLVATTTSFGYKDLESEIYLILGESYLDSDIDSALTLFNKVIDINLPKYTTKAYILRSELYIGRGNYYQAGLDLKKAFLNVRLLNSDYLTIEVADRLNSLYKITGNSKERAVALETMGEIIKRRSDFILKERDEIYQGDFYKTKLKEDYEKSSLLVSILVYVTIVLGVALICVVVFLSIQSYRLRHITLGKN